jgi:hypothetical protein
MKHSPIIMLPSVRKPDLDLIDDAQLVRLFYPPIHQQRGGELAHPQQDSQKIKPLRN